MHNCKVLLPDLNSVKMDILPTHLLGCCLLTHPVSFYAEMKMFVPSTLQQSICLDLLSYFQELKPIAITYILHITIITCIHIQ